MLSYVITIIVLIPVARETKTHRVATADTLEIPCNREER